MRANRYRFVLCIALTLTVSLPATPAGAVEVSGLFSADVTIDGDSREDRDTAYRRALTSVIARLAPAARPSDPAVAEVLAGARQLVMGYREIGAQRMWVSFDGPTLVAALRQRGVAVWGSDRPLTIVWLAVDRGSGERDIVSASTEHARGDRARSAKPADFLRERMERAATRRGLPIVLPLMDTVDRQHIEFADVWGDFAATIARASERYAAVSLLVGRAGPGQSDSIRWTFRFGGTEERFTGSVETAIDRLTRDLGATLAIADPADVRRVSVYVDDVDDVSEFGRLLKFLERQPQLTEVNVLGMDGARLELELAFAGPQARIEQLLESGPGLQSVSAPRPVFGSDDSSMALQPSLYFRLGR